MRKLHWTAKKQREDTHEMAIIMLRPSSMKSPFHMPAAGAREARAKCGSEG